MPTADKTGKAIRYWLNRRIRALAMGVMKRLTPNSIEEQFDLRRENIQRILLVCSIFRMGDLILATPAILLMRKNFPHAKIDFVGPSVVKVLFQKLPIDHQYEVFKSFPKVCWSYIVLLKQIRAAKYDLAVDICGSSAALGAFIIGFSQARLRAGARGKWDFWFNLRVAKPARRSQYANRPQLIAALGLESELVFPKVALSAEEKEIAKRRVATLLAANACAAMAAPAESKIVGFFVGGRITRGKRWEKESFLELIRCLLADGTRLMLFVGPEERELLPYFSAAFSAQAAVVCEPNARAFAGMIANCDLFIACDSGPVHLACALGIRTVAIFLRNNFAHWGPPAELARIVYRDKGPTVDMVLTAYREELALLSQRDPAAGGSAVNDATAVARA
ncbi:MAG: lipopolysaccharide heptosyltransferase family protein [Deltaproteobacteria bacterium]|nr:lipopolysaccharide heptosyltransferase family protein [Deltaproteobacteria bacterium]